MRKLTIILLFAFMTFALIGCNKEEKIEIEEDDTLIMTKTNDDEITSSLYIKSENGNEKKLCNNLLNTYENGNIYYLNGKNKCLYVDSNGNLQVVSENEEKNKLGSDIANVEYTIKEDEYSGNMNSEYDDINTTRPDGFGASKNGNLVAYMDYNSNLYVKKGDDEREKVASDVTGFKIDENGQYIYYIKDGYELYVYSNDKKEKITSDVTDFKISLDGKIIVWTNSSSELYKRDLNSEDKEKISDDESIAYSALINEDGSIIYLSDIDGSSGELYMYNNDKKEKLASDVWYFYGVGKQIYYINTDCDLYMLDINNKNKKDKISVDIIDAKVKDSSIYFVDEDMNIYKKESNKEKEKIGNDLLDLYSYNVIEDNLIYSKSDNSIYLNDNKIASGTKGFAFNSQYVAYIDSKNQVHIYDIKNKKDFIQIKDCTKYSNIYLGNKLLFSYDNYTDDYNNESDDDYAGYSTQGDNSQSTEVDIDYNDPAITNRARSLTDSEYNSFLDNTIYPISSYQDTEVYLKDFFDLFSNIHGKSISYNSGGYYSIYISGVGKDGINYDIFFEVNYPSMEVISVTDFNNEHGNKTANSCLISTYNELLKDE